MPRILRNSKKILKKNQKSSQLNMEEHSTINGIIVPDMVNTNQVNSHAQSITNSSSEQSDIKNEMFAKINLNQMLPQFEGSPTDNIEFFFSQYEEITDLAKIPPIQKTLLLKSRLKGEALQLLSTDVSMRSETNYDKLKSMLLDNYFKQKSLLQKQTEFQSILQLPGMNVRQLALKIKSAAKIYLSKEETEKPESKILMDRILLAKFCDSLKPELKFELRKANPNSFEEAVKIAAILDDAYNENAMSVNAITFHPKNQEILKLQDEQKLTNTKIEELKQNLVNFVVSQPDTSKQKNSHKATDIIKCMACGKLGHLLVDCWHYLHFQSTNNQNMIHTSKRQNFRQNNFQARSKPYNRANRWKTPNQNATENNTDNRTQFNSRNNYPGRFQNKYQTAENKNRGYASRKFSNSGN